MLFHLDLTCLCLSRRIHFCCPCCPAWQSTLMGQLEQTKSSEATPAALQLRDKLRAVEAQLDRLKYDFQILTLHHTREGHAHIT